MTTVRSKKTGRVYSVKSQLYGTSNLVQSLYLGGIFLAGTGSRGPSGESSTTLEDTIARADARADDLGIEIDDDPSEIDSIAKRLRQVRDALNKCKNPELIEEIGKLLNV